MAPSDLIRSLLLVSPKTYNYHQILSEACVHSAIDFIWLDERPSSFALFKLISRKLNKLARKLSVRHYLSHLQRIKSSGFVPSHILVIKGESIDPSIAAYMRRIFPAAKLVLYFWDSTSNLPGYHELVKLFDVVASFDSLDCRLKGWHYHPLFCGNPAEVDTTLIASGIKSRYDWSFVGVVHSDRLLVLDKLIQASRSTSSFFVYVYFPSLLHFFYFFLVSPLPFLRLRKYFRSSPLLSSRLRSVYGQSRCILDIHHPGQSGLTMRTIESVVSGIKLATTNPSVSRDIFYDSTRVFIVDRSSPSVSSDFLAVEANPLPESVSGFFRPSSWLCSLLSIKPSNLDLA
jgi:hypothetical protein